MEAAEALYKRVLATAPQHFGAFYGLGFIAAHNRDHKNAVMWVERALAVDPNHAEAHYNLGNALRELGRLEEALSSYRRAEALAPRQPEIFVNLGVTLRAQDDLDGAVESYQRALALKPDIPDALSNLGVAYQMQGRLDEAIASFERALALRPDFPMAHTNLALALFLTGEFARAAEEYEWRWQAPGFPKLPKHEAPPWDGRPLPDGAVLLRVEQGFGDAIQFIRYAPLVRQRCGRVVLECPKELAALMATAPGVDEVAVWGGPAPAVAAQLPVMSLIRVFETRLETIPANVPYLAADPARVAKIRGRIEAARGLKVGLVWAGRPTFREDRNRSLASLSMLEPLLGVEGVTFFALQKGGREREIAALGLSDRIVDLAPALDDFADTAAAISQLDLVISTCTSVPHLAGALAKPVWTMLPFAADWRWLEGRADSPWYPSMRLFRQPLRGDWTSAIARVAQELRGAVHRKTGPFVQARQREVPPRRPDDSQRLLVEARRHHQSGRLDDAEMLYRRVIAAHPGHFGALYSLAAVAAQRGDHRATEAWMRRALAVAPNYAEAHYNLGIALIAQRRFEDAAASLRQAAALEPRRVDAHYNLGIALSGQGQLEEAITSYRQALTAKPDHTGAQGNLANALRAQGRIDEALAAYRRALKLDAESPLVHSNYLLCLQSDPSLGPGELLKEHQAYGARMPSARPWANPGPGDPEKRLKIGYVSPDLRGHPVGHFLMPVMAAHDRTRFSVHCYCGNAQEDQITASLKGKAEVWRSTIGVGDEEIAAMVRADGIDILVDLAGHTANNRLPVFALKPAPVQVTWLGYPGTTGLKAMDYRLTDASADPEDEAGAFATETLFRLPHGFHCYQPPGPTPAVAPSPALSTGRVTFGSFNQLTKLNRSVVALWSTILRAIPTARLLLKSWALRDDGTRQRYLEQFDALGIEAGRVEMIGQIDSFSGHLDQYGRVDIALDPFPYNGVTTTCEALWMGVPVVALRGNRHAARIGASLLSTIGLKELIADDTDSYVTIAVDLAREADRLAALRAGLRDRMRASPLCDAAGFTREIETAYGAMWQRWCAQPEAEASEGAGRRSVVPVIRSVPEAGPRGDGADAAVRPTDDLAVEPSHAYSAAHEDGMVAGTKRKEAPRQPTAEAQMLAEAVGHFRAGRLDEAEALYRRMVATDPQHFAALYGLGAVAMRRADYHAAEAWISRALLVAPDHAEAHYNLGVALQTQNRFDRAAESFRRVIALRPSYVEAHNNLGVALQKLNRLKEAEENYRRALALKPDYVGAHFNLGNVLQAQGRVEEAAAAFRSAVALESENAEAHYNLGVALEALTRPKEAAAAYRRALELRPDYREAHSNLIFALNFDPDVGPEEQQAERARWYEMHGRSHNILCREYENSREPERKLRIGYVSAHFRHQAATYAFASFLLGHDASRFEVFCYSDTVDEDDLSKRFRSASTQWRRVVGLSDDELEQTIREDRIDILVDLVGHMFGSRLPVFARKPAPIQVTGWGEPTGTGLPTIDYLFGDRVLVPTEQRHLLAERVIDLPCFLSFWSPDTLPAASPLPARLNGHVTFGSFNRSTKMSDAVLRRWSAILRAVPSARLVLKDRGLEHHGQRDRVLSIFAKEGIAPERLTMLGYLGRKAHFAAYRTIDIALDPFPHSGGMTTLDALCMGVPVITLPGPTISSRLAAAILTPLRLERFIASDLDDYTHLATSIANELDALASLRAELRARVLSSPIGNAAAYTSAVEAAYRRIWRDWCKASRPPSGHDRCDGGNQTESPSPMPRATDSSAAFASSGGRQ